MLRLLLAIAIREWTENVSKICRKRYQTQEKFQKFISSPFEAKSKTTFDYFSPEIDRKRAEDIADYIFATGKNSKNYSESSEANLKTTFDYCSPEIDRKRAEDISDTILVPEKIPKNLSKPLKQIRRLLSTISVQKLIKNAWKIFLMIYQSRKNSNKLFRVI
jgi:hypothetical protein